jgi:protein TonB
MTNTRLPLSQFVVVLTALAFLLGGTALPAQDAPQNPTEVVYERKMPGMTLPKAVYQPNPEYAERPRKKKLQGTVLLSMIVSPDGTVRDPQVTRSLDKDLDKKALESVRKWKFEPATKDGEPVAYRVVVEINFHLY